MESYGRRNQAEEMQLMAQEIPETWEWYHRKGAYVRLLGWLFNLRETREGSLPL